MNRSLIIGLVVALLAVIFTLQNIDPTSIKLLFWELQASTALVIIIALLLGAIVAILMSIGGSNTKKREIADLREENRDLKMRLKDIEYRRTEPSVVPATAKSRPGDPTR